jgi:DNA-binding NtrC family response regulator
MPDTHARIMIVDDEKMTNFILNEYLLSQGYDVVCCATGYEALSQLETQKVDLVISDLVMPGLDGIQLMLLVKERHPTLPFIFFTAQGSIESAVNAITHGALDYLEKPINPLSLDVALKRALEFGRLSGENAQLRGHFRERFSFHKIVTHSPAMRQTLEMAARVAASPKTTVSLTGESGVGKEVLARAIHFESNCLPDSFVAVNCAAIPDSLLESELFGMFAVPLPAPSRTGRESSAWRAEGLCFWTKSETCPCSSRPSSCGCWRRGPSKKWAPIRHCRLISG